MVQGDVRLSKKWQKSKMQLEKCYHSDIPTISSSFLFMMFFQETPSAVVENENSTVSQRRPVRLGEYGTLHDDTER